MVAAWQFFERDIVERLIATLPWPAIQRALEFQFEPDCTVVSAGELEAQAVGLNQVGWTEDSHRNDRGFRRCYILDFPFPDSRSLVNNWLAVDVYVLVHCLDLKLVSILHKRSGDVRRGAWCEQRSINGTLEGRVGLVGGEGEGRAQA